MFVLIASQADQHAFVVFHAAADADCAAIDSSLFFKNFLHYNICNYCYYFERSLSRVRHYHFPHSRGPLSVHVVGSKRLIESELREADSNPYKIFAAPIPDDIIGHNEQNCDFFSRWGLVVTPLRD